MTGFDVYIHPAWRQAENGKYEAVVIVGDSGKMVVDKEQYDTQEAAAEAAIALQKTVMEVAKKSAKALGLIAIPHKGKR